MGLRTTASLAGAVLALGAVLWLTNEKPTQQGDVAVALLGNHRLASATRMFWQFRDEDAVEIRREPGGPFRLTYPIMDLVAAEHLVNVAATFESAMLAEAPLQDTPENREKTGLDRPRVVVDLEFEDGQKDHFEIGADGPLGNDLFVRRNGQIYRGGLALHTALHKGLDDLRERQVFRTPPSAVAEVVVDRKTKAGEREVMRLARSGDGWRLVEPIEARAAASSANAFVGNVLAMRIDMFVSGPLILPDGPPDLVLTLRGGAKEEQLKLWLDTQDNLLGRLDDRKISFRMLNLQYHRIFSETADELRSRILVPMADIYHEITTMMVDPGSEGRRLLLRRDSVDAPWLLAEPVQGAADPQATNELITAINNLRALSFLPADTQAESCGLGVGALVLSVQGTSDPSPHRLRLGSNGQRDGMDITHAAVQDSPGEVVAVPRGAVDVIRRSWTAYVPRRLFAVTEAVTRVDLAGRGDRKRQLLVGEGGKWTDPSGAPVDDGVVADVVDLLRDLQARSVHGQPPKELGEPDWTLVMSRNYDPPDATGFGVLEVWERAGLPLLVRSRTGHAEVAFELSPLDSKNLEKLWN